MLEKAADSVPRPTVDFSHVTNPFTRRDLEADPMDLSASRVLEMAEEALRHAARDLCNPCITNGLERMELAQTAVQRAEDSPAMAHRVIQAFWLR